MPPVFVDTAYHIAIFNAGDPLHGSATALANELAPDRSSQFVSTHLVLAEFLASASRATHLRVQAADYVRAFIAAPPVIIVETGAPLFERALQLYGSREDKRYSLVDCVSMIVCHDLGITDVLTSDHDFEQEGFNILLQRRT